MFRYRLHKRYQIEANYEYFNDPKTTKVKIIQWDDVICTEVKRFMSYLFKRKRLSINQKITNGVPIRISIITSVEFIGIMRKFKSQLDLKVWIHIYAPSIFCGCYVCPPYSNFFGRSLIMRRIIFFKWAILYLWWDCT